MVPAQVNDSKIDNWKTADVMCSLFFSLMGENMQIGKIYHFIVYAGTFSMLILSNMYAEDDQIKRLLADRNHWRVGKNSKTK